MDASWRRVLALASDVRACLATPHESEYWDRRVDVLARAGPRVSPDANALAVWDATAASAAATAATSAAAAAVGPSYAGGA